MSCWRSKTFLSLGAFGILWLEGGFVVSPGFQEFSARNDAVISLCEEATGVGIVRRYEHLSLAEQ